MADTIAAVSTLMGRSAIGILRMSGDDAVTIAERVFAPDNGKKLGDCRTRCMINGALFGENSVLGVAEGSHKGSGSVKRSDTLAEVARKLGKTTVPCKVRLYESRLEELRALMGANIHRRSLTPFDMARQLEVLQEELKNANILPENVKEQAEMMAKQTELSRATVERYLDLLNLDETLTAWAESGKMTMTDAYELARKKNQHLYPIVEEFVHSAKDQSDFPALVHRAILWAKAAEMPPPPPKKVVSNPLTTVDSFGRAIRRSTTQLKTLNLSETDPITARRKLDTCLANLEELRRTVETLRASLEE